MKKFFTWSIIVLLGAGMSCTVQKQINASETAVTAANIKETSLLEQQVDSIMQPLLYPGGTTAGIAVGIVQDGAPLLLKAYGKADLELDVPLSIDASFEIGSITKQFTAVAILQLAEKGLIHLNAPVSKYITFNTKYPVTINHLLHHTSGIKDPPKSVIQSLERHKYKRDTLLRLIEKEGFDFEPGTAMLYSNKGYFILGLLIEKVSGLSYEQYLQKNIFEPAGMKNSYYTDYETIRKDRAHGYNYLPHYNKNVILAEQTFHYWVYAAGSLSSTVNDLLKWLNVLHNSEKILNKKSYEQLITAGQLNNGMASRYAKGTMVLNTLGYTMMGHGGNISGFISNAVYFPDKKLSIVYLRNTLHQENPNNLVYAIAEKILPPLHASEKKFEGDLFAFKGIYQMPKYVGDVTIAVESSDSALIMKRSWMPTADTLTYMGNQKWSLGDDHYSFVMEKGKAKEMIWDSGPLAVRLNKQ